MRRSGRARDVFILPESSADRQGRCVSVLRLAFTEGRREVDSSCGIAQKEYKVDFIGSGILHDLPSRTHISQIVGERAIVPNPTRNLVIDSGLVHTGV